MKAALAKNSQKQYLSLPKQIQKAFDKQVGFLLENHRHPSLNSKKYDESTNLWQARVDKSYRFYFFIQNDVYMIVSIKKHPK